MIQLLPNSKDEVSFRRLVIRASNFFRRSAPRPSPGSDRVEAPVRARENSLRDKDNYGIRKTTRSKERMVQSRGRVVAVYLQR